MSERTILKVESPKTQTIEAVKSLLAWKHHPVNPLPCDVSLENGRVVLVLSNKKDCFYVTTSRACSCPAHNWHPGQRCKHQRKYFPEVMAATKSAVEMERKPFKPFLEDEARPAKAEA